MMPRQSAAFISSNGLHQVDAGAIHHAIQPPERHSAARAYRTLDLGHVGARLADDRVRSPNGTAGPIQQATGAPSASNSAATAWPMPEALPVTTIRRPCRRIAVTPCRRRCGSSDQDRSNGVMNFKVKLHEPHRQPMGPHVVVLRAAASEHREVALVERAGLPQHP